MINIDRSKCIGCGLCVKDCVCNVIKLKNEKAFVESENCLYCGHCVAICPKKAIEMNDFDEKEIKEFNNDKFLLDAETLLNVMKFRRSVRQFEERSVEKEKLRQIIEAGRYSPTAKNMQNVSYIVVQKGIGTLERLALKRLRLMLKLVGFVGKFSKASYNVGGINLDDNDFLFKGAPTLILVVSENDVNASLASSYMELMAHTLGLGMFYVGFFTRAAKGSKKIRNLLGLKPNENIVTCLALGYPSVKYQRTVPRKKPLVKWR